MKINLILFYILVSVVYGLMFIADSNLIYVIVLLYVADINLKGYLGGLKK